MVRKYVWIITGLVAGVMIAAVFFIIPKQTSRINELSGAVPPDASMIIETQDIGTLLAEITRENKLWAELAQFPAISDADSLIQQLDSLSILSPALNELIHGGKSLLAFFVSGKESPDFLLITSPGKKFSFRALSDFITSMAPEGEIEERSYNGARILRTKYFYHETERNLVFSNIKGLVLASSSSVVLERAIRHMELETGLPNEKGFKRVSATAGKNVEANIYLNYDQLPGMVSLLLQSSIRDRVLELDQLASWGELDVNLKEDAILMNGFTYKDDSSNHILSIFNGQDPVTLGIHEVLPANTSLFLSIGIEKMQVFRDRYNNYLERSGKIRNRINQLTRNGINPTSGLDERLYNVMDEEVCLFFTDLKNLSIEENSYVVMETKSRAMAEEAIVEILAILSNRPGGNADEYRRIINIDDETSFPFYLLPVEGLPAMLFGELFSGAPFTHLTFYDNYIIFGNSTEALSKYLHNNLLGKTLGNQQEYISFSEYLSSRYNFHFYLNPSRSNTFFNRFFSSRVSGAIMKQNENMNRLQAMAFQFSNEDNSLVYNNLFARYNPEFREEAKTEWESLLDTVVAIKPQMVTNHYTKEQEIFVQDGKDNIYLINSTGRILWKQKVDGPIIGEVYQLDYYRNNKLQLLFNTANKIYMIDRNGNNVERYPVTLRARATNGLSMFDYDKTRSYRIFIACADKQVYAYNQEGNLVKGWRFGGTEHLVTLPVNHFRIGSKDYIVFSDRMRIYILDRRGNERVKVAEQFPLSPNNNIMLDEHTSGPSRMVTTDNTGQVVFISFDGRTEKRVLGEFSNSHFFHYRDLDGNGTKEFIYTDSNRLTAFNTNGSRRFNFEFNSEVRLKPNIYQFARNDLKLGVAIPEENQIFLINNDGKLYSGFPLQGNTSFSIGKLKNSNTRFSLIVGNEDNFLFNYSVQ